jgi:hypothetical protein
MRLRTQQTRNPLSPPHSLSRSSSQRPSRPVAVRRSTTERMPRLQADRLQVRAALRQLRTTPMPMRTVPKIGAEISSASAGVGRCGIDRRADVSMRALCLVCFAALVACTLTLGRLCRKSSSDVSGGVEPETSQVPLPADQPLPGNVQRRLRERPSRYGDERAHEGGRRSSMMVSHLSNFAPTARGLRHLSGARLPARPQMD